jgi:hypothetical protein
MRNKHWIDRIDSYHFFGVSVGKVIGVFLLLICIFGSLSLFLMITPDVPPPTDRFIAEISRRWTEEIHSDTGGYWVYWVGMKQEDREYICRISSPHKDMWYNLEVGERYKIEVSRSWRHCYINKATKIDEVGLKVSVTSILTSENPPNNGFSIVTDSYPYLILIH